MSGFNVCGRYLVVLFYSAKGKAGARRKEGEVERRKEEVKRLRREVEKVEA